MILLLVKNTQSSPIIKMILLKERETLMSLRMLDFDVEWIFQMYSLLAITNKRNHFNRIVIEHHDNFFPVWS